MESFITAAIIGTDQSGDTALVTNTRIDELTNQLTEGDKERRLLLAAGAWGAYTQAGHIAQPAPESPEVAPAEAEGWQALPRTHSLETLLTLKEKLLLPEVFALMRERRYYVPYDLLPLVLDYATGDKTIAPSVLSVLGERGRWLARLNSGWKWVLELDTDVSSLTPEQLETRWQEGTARQRLEVLAYKRRNEPALARQWLEQVWKQERAETRSSFIEVLSDNLSADDEAFLEKALDDRSEKVREKAAALLASLPTSAYVQRMYARADQLLQYQDGKLVVTIIDEMDQTWIHDGLTDKVERKQSYRVVASQRVLERLPFAYWERFQLSPAKLVAAITDETWRNRLFSIWAKVAIQRKQNDWALDLLTYWNQDEAATKDAELLETGQELIAYLFTICSQQEAEEFMQSRLRDKHYHMLSHMRHLPRPWSHEFSLFFLQWGKESVGAFVSSLSLNQSEDRGLEEFWDNFFPQTALALSPSSFASASQGWVLPELPEKYHYNVYYKHHRIENNINRFIELLQYRKNLLEEIG